VKFFWSTTKTPKLNKQGTETEFPKKKNEEKTAVGESGTASFRSLLFFWLFCIFSINQKKAKKRPGEPRIDGKL